MHVDDTNYRDGLVITGMLTEKAWVRPSFGGCYTVQVGASELLLLSAHEIVTLGEALVKYGKDRVTADARREIGMIAGTKGA